MKPYYNIYTHAIYYWPYIRVGTQGNHVYRITSPQVCVWPIDRCEYLNKSMNYYINKIYVFKQKRLLFPHRGIEPRPRPWKGHILTDRLMGRTRTGLSVESYVYILCYRHEHHLKKEKNIATNRDRTSDLKIFSLTLSQLSYWGLDGTARKHLCYTLSVFL